MHPAGPVWVTQPEASLQHDPQGQSRHCLLPEDCDSPGGSKSRTPVPGSWSAASRQRVWWTTYCNQPSSVWGSEPHPKHQGEWQIRSQFIIPLEQTCSFLWGANNPLWFVIWAVKRAVFLKDCTKRYDYGQARVFTSFCVVSVHRRLS